YHNRYFQLKTCVFLNKVTNSKVTLFDLEHSCTVPPVEQAAPFTSDRESPSNFNTENPELFCYDTKKRRFDYSE
ncbi:hypothetical protein ACFRA1_11370, partial [Bacillus subtilis]